MSCTASSRVFGVVGLGTLRFLEARNGSSTSLLESLSTRRKKSRSASGLSRRESKLVLLDICWSFFRTAEILVNTAPLDNP